MNKKIDAKETKKWDYYVISDDTDAIFSEFNQIYSKNREAARYFINKDMTSCRIVAFINKNAHIIVKERVAYGVSVSLKRYKSTKTLEKFYLDTTNGSISKYSNGKFIPCKPSEISEEIKNYIVSKIRWIDFVFKLSLPVTFTTIVSKKLYSQRKLLTWFWSTNYPTSLKLSQIKDSFVISSIRKNLKNITNINNINPEFFDADLGFRGLFLATLRLAVKTMKTINAAWSPKRLMLEKNKMSRIVLDTLYEHNDKTLSINDLFLPFLNKIKSHGYYIPRTTRDISKLCNSVEKVEQIISTISTLERDFFTAQTMPNNKLVIKRGNFISILRCYIKNNTYSFSAYDTYTIKEVFVPTVISNGIYFNSNRPECIDLIDDLNKCANNIVKSQERKKKILKLEEEFL